ncbi:helix-turn-helix transcriptional regulator [Alkalicoccobacillus gibsonii]|uniref:Helix-turn-helix transcriptional regulator n=1 Tax=Alkalicoccobacillus gibsonii TaxID=79881 RepID=A0ABU9VEE5_9BACI
MSLGQRLKISRIKKNLKQIDAAKKLNVSSNVLSSYERDIRDPDTASLLRIAQFYEVSTDYLLGNNNEYSAPRHPLEPVVEEFINEVNLEDYSFLQEELDEESKMMIKTLLESSLNIISNLKQHKE